MKMKLIVLSVFLLTILVTNGQARLKIVNNSGRIMTVKGISRSSLYQNVEISPYSSETVYFSVSDTYFTKSKAVLTLRETIYKKGRRFNVTNDETGYSVLTFTIKESAIAESSGQTISKTEFDQN